MTCRCPRWPKSWRRSTAFTRGMPWYSVACTCKPDTSPVTASTRSSSRPGTSTRTSPRRSLRPCTACRGSVADAERRVRFTDTGCFLGRGGFRGRSEPTGLDMNRAMNKVGKTAPLPGRADADMVVDSCAAAHPTLRDPKASGHLSHPSQRWRCRGSSHLQPQTPTGSFTGPP